MPDFKHLEYEVSENVAEITMCREPVNAINIELIDSILAAYRTASEDDDVRAIVLTSGVEKAFSAGADLNEVDKDDMWQYRERGKKVYYEHFDAQHNMGKPTVAAVTGPAYEAGVTLAVNCNCIVVNEEADWGYSATKLGFYPGMHIHHLPKIIGRHRAFEILYTGETLTGKEVEELGIANYAVPEEDVKPKARDLAREFAEVPRQAMAVGHLAFMRTNDLDVRRSRQWQIPTLAMLHGMHSASEGVNAFAEDREPEW